MTKAIILVLEDKVHERIAVLKTLYGKYDKATVVENGIFDYFQVPTLKWEVYTKEVPKGDGMMITKVKAKFKGL